MGLAAALVPGAVQACRVSTDHRAFIHDSLPAVLEAGLIVADVDFSPVDVDTIFETGVHARVRKMIQGEYRGDTLIVRPMMLTSCSHPFGNGTSGLIVAVPIGVEDGRLVVDPIAVSRASGFRLPPGFRLPKGFLDGAVLRDEDQRKR